MCFYFILQFFLYCSIFLTKHTTTKLQRFHKFSVQNNPYFLLRVISTYFNVTTFKSPFAALQIPFCTSIRVVAFFSVSPKLPIFLKLVHKRAFSRTSASKLFRARPRDKKSNLRKQFDVLM